MTRLADITVASTIGVGAARDVFEREGLLVVKDLLPALAVHSVEHFLRTALAELEPIYTRYGLSMADPALAEQLSKLIHEPPRGLSASHKHTFLGHFPLDVRLDRALWTIPRALSRHPLLPALLGTRRLYAHMPPTARYVLPHCALARVPLHQDVSYNRHLTSFCVVWAPLVPIDEACAGMAAYPRSHTREEMLPTAAVNAAEGWLPPIDAASIDPAQRLVLSPLQPGDVVILAARTFHESLANHSDRVRLSVDYRFFGETARSTKHYLDIDADVVVAPTNP